MKHDLKLLGLLVGKSRIERIKPLQPFAATFRGIVPQRAITADICIVVGSHANVRAFREVHRLGEYDATVLKCALDGNHGDNIAGRDFGSN